MDNNKIWTPLRVVGWLNAFFQSKGIAGARPEAEELVAFALGMQRIDVYLDGDRPCEPEELKRLRQLIQDRLAGVPLAYLTGSVMFSFLNLEVSRRVLIPRTDTECLTDAIIAAAREYRQAGIKSQSLRILELGTGSGNIALTLACSLEKVVVDAVDISADALRVAERNLRGARAKFTNPTNEVNFILSDKFSAVPLSDNYDLVVSNPPYLSESDLIVFGEELRYEPREALYASDDGLEFYLYLAEAAVPYLRENGELFIEHGYRQREAIQHIFDNARSWKCLRAYDDINGVPRVLRYQRLKEREA